MKIKRFNESELQGPEGKIDIVNNMSQSKSEETMKNLRNQLSINKKNITVNNIRKLSLFKNYTNFIYVARSIS
jgi:hypothetical protein